MRLLDLGQAHVHQDQDSTGLVLGDPSGSLSAPKFRRATSFASGQHAAAGGPAMSDFVMNIPTPKCGRRHFSNFLGTVDTLPRKGQTSFGWFSKSESEESKNLCCCESKKGWLVEKPKDEIEADFEGGSKGQTRIDIWKKNGWEVKEIDGQASSGEMPQDEGKHKVKLVTTEEFKTKWVPDNSDKPGSDPNNPPEELPTKAIKDGAYLSEICDTSGEAHAPPKGGPYCDCHKAQNEDLLLSSKLEDQISDDPSLNTMKPIPGLLEQEPFKSALNAFKTKAKAQGWDAKSGGFGGSKSLDERIAKGFESAFQLKKWDKMDGGGANNTGETRYVCCCGDTNRCEKKSSCGGGFFSGGKEHRAKGLKAKELCEEPPPP